MYKVRVIEVQDCLHCPLRELGECKAWNKLTSKQKFIIQTSSSINVTYLKDCELKEIVIKDK